MKRSNGFDNLDIFLLGWLFGGVFGFIIRTSYRESMVNELKRTSLKSRVTAVYKDGTPISMPVLSGGEVVLDDGRKLIGRILHVKIRQLAACLYHFEQLQKKISYLD